MTDYLKVARGGEEKTSTDHLATALRDMRSVHRLAKEAQAALQVRDLQTLDITLGDIRHRASMSADFLGTVVDRELGREVEDPSLTRRFAVHRPYWQPKRAEQVEPTGVHEVTDMERVAIDVEEAPDER